MDLYDGVTGSAPIRKEDGFCDSSPLTALFFQFIESRGKKERDRRIKRMDKKAPLMFDSSRQELTFAVV